MILNFHDKFGNTLAENSSGQLKTEVRLTRFNIFLKQFHEKPIKDEVKKIRLVFLNGQASRPQ